MRSLVFVLILSATTFGCSSKKEKEAAPTSDHTQNGTNDEPDVPSDHAADDKATEDLQAKRAEEAKAIDVKAAADVEAVKVHAATQIQLQASFDALDRRFTALKERDSKLSAAKQQVTSPLVAEAEKAEAKMMASIATLRDATLPQWNAARAKVDTDSAAFTKSIDALETAMQ